MKTIYESYNDLNQKVTKIEEEFKNMSEKKFFDLFSQFIHTNPKNSEQVFDQLSKLNNYEDKYNYLKSVMYSSNKTYINSISDDYIKKIRGL